MGLKLLSDLSINQGVAIVFPAKKRGSLLQKGKSEKIVYRGPRERPRGQKNILIHLIVNLKVTNNYSFIYVVYQQ